MTPVCIVLFFIPLLMSRYHFSGDLQEEAPFFLGKFVGGWWSFYVFMSKTMLEVCCSFHFMVHALPGDQVI